MLHLNFSPITKALAATVFFLIASLSSIKNVQAKNSGLEHLTAAENIGILSQSIVKNYFYLGENLNTHRSKQKLGEHIKTIDSNLTTLKSIKSNENIQSDLVFVEMIWTELKSALTQDYTRDTGLLIIDMGEVLLEGSENITAALHNSEANESEAIDVIEHQRYLIERMAKLYIISIAGFKDFNVVKQTGSTVQTFDAGLAKIELNTYPIEIKTKVEKLRKRWNFSRSFYLNVKEGDLPKTIFFNTEMIERLLSDIFDHHI